MAFCLSPLFLSYLLKSECTIFCLFLSERKLISFLFYKNISFLTKTNVYSFRCHDLNIPRQVFVPPDSQNNYTLSLFGLIIVCHSYSMYCACIICFVVIVVVFVVNSVIIPVSVVSVSIMVVVGVMVVVIVIVIYYLLHCCHHFCCHRFLQLVKQLPLVCQRVHMIVPFIFALLLR